MEMKLVARSRTGEVVSLPDGIFHDRGDARDRAYENEVGLSVVVNRQYKTCIWNSLADYNTFLTVYCDRMPIHGCISYLMAILSLKCSVARTSW